MTLKNIGSGVVFSVLAATGINAAPISGSFNISGTVIITSSTIDWQSNNAPFTALQATIGPGATGSFAGLDGTTVTIEDLNSATEPTGSLFGPDLFISFNADPALAPLDINMIFGGIYTTAECTEAPAVGQQCTPNNLSPSGTSPFNFVNNPPAPGQATDTWAFAGIEGTSNWTGNFTSQFTVPHQTVLAALATSGSVSNTFSANFSVTAAPTLTPETSSVSMVVLGLALVGLARAGLISKLYRRNG
jgi:hypothetical protein